VVVEVGASVCALGLVALGGEVSCAGGDCCATAKLPTPIQAAANIAILKFMAVPLVDTPTISLQPAQPTHHQCTSPACVGGLLPVMAGPGPSRRQRPVLSHL